MSGYMASDYDPYMLAEAVGQQYNPYQGYPLKQVSDQIWDVYGPTPDYLIAQMASQMNPNPDQFSNDVFMGADPLLRGPLAEALSNSKGDTIGAYNYLQDPEFVKRLTKQVGRTEWDQLAASGDIGSLAAITGKEKDKAAIGYYQRGLEELLAQGAPSRNRQLGNLDSIREREGGMAKPGTGMYPGDEMGMGGGRDPMGDLAIPDRVDITEAGAGSKRDRMEFSQGQAYANIGGRRYAVQGDPLDRLALQRVVLDRQSRTREDEKTRKSDKKKNDKKAQAGRGFLDMLRSGTLVSNPFG